MRLRQPIAFIMSAAVAASALTGCDSFSGHAAAAANSAQVQQLIEFIADLGLERDLRQALQSGGDLRQALLTLLGLESAVNFNVDDLASARPGQHAVQVWEVTAQSAEDAAALAASQIRAVLEQLKSNGVTEGRIGMVEIDGKYYVVVDVEVTEENTFEPVKPVSDDDSDEEQQPQEAEATFDGDTLTITGGNGTLNADTLGELLGSENPGWKSTVKTVDLSQSGYTQIGKPGDVYGSGAFADCKNLVSVTLPSTVTEIGSYAFDGCGSLKEVNLSGCTNLTTIGNSAFYECRGLTSINLGNCTGLTSIGDGAFAECYSLEEINLGNCTGLTSIGSYAFAGSGLTLIDLSNTNVLNILHSTFADCHGLTEVKLPMDLATIEGSNGGTFIYGAFRRCDNLKNITFYSVPKIGMAAFYGVITDDRTLTIHCPNNIRDALQEKLTQSGSFTADDFTGDKIEFADIAPLTYLFGF